MLWSSKRERPMDKVSTTAYKERSIALTLPSYTPSSIARITSGAILHGQNDKIGGTCVRGRWEGEGGRKRGKEKGEGEGGRRGGREKGREKRREKAHQKGVPTKEFAGALDDAEPKSA